jgi:hypothetical protein
MSSFKEFNNFIDFIINEFDNNQTQSNQLTPQQQNIEVEEKLWSAKKAEILRFWKALKPDMPIVIHPMTEKPEGVERSSYGEDGIRISGSYEFIISVLGKLKQILTYENPNTRLRLIFRAVDRSKLLVPNKRSYVFYINLENRSKKRKRKNII